MPIQNNEGHTPENTSENKFNSVEAVESVYTADDIELLESESAQVAANDPVYGETSDSVQYAEPSIYCLDSIRLKKQHRQQERRASKDKLSDRRAECRVDASGEVQRDRRAANRLANLSAIRDSADQKQ